MLLKATLKVILLCYTCRLSFLVYLEFWRNNDSNAHIGNMTLENLHPSLSSLPLFLTVGVTESKLSFVMTP